jgi:hypothetical protein
LPQETIDVFDEGKLVPVIRLDRRTSAESDASFPVDEFASQIKALFSLSSSDVIAIW